MTLARRAMCTKPGTVNDIRSLPAAERRSTPQTPLFLHEFYKAENKDIAIENIVGRD